MNNISFDLDNVKIVKVKRNGFTEIHKVYPMGTSDVSLHRFLNPAGVPFSAIYEGENEVMNCDNTYSEEGSSERRMLMSYLQYNYLPSLTADFLDLYRRGGNAKCLI